MMTAGTLHARPGLRERLIVAAIAAAALLLLGSRAARATLRRSSR